MRHAARSSVIGKLAFAATSVQPALLQALEIRWAASRREAVAHIVSWNLRVVQYLSSRKPAIEVCRQTPYLCIFGTNPVNCTSAGTATPKLVW